MPSLSRRDAVGLAALVLTGALVLPFLAPEGGQTAREPFAHIPVALTQTPVTPAAARPTATPTPLPAFDAGTPKAGWYIRYFRGAPGSIEDGQRFVPKLDLAYDAAPFNDMRDDAWSLTAAGAFDLGPGRYTFRFEHDGGLRVLANGSEIANQPDAPIARVLEVTVTHDGGPLSLELEARDSGGKFLLRER